MVVINVWSIWRILVISPILLSFLFLYLSLLFLSFLFHRDLNIRNVKVMILYVCQVVNFNYLPNNYLSSYLSIYLSIYLTIQLSNYVFVYHSEIKYNNMTNLCHYFFQGFYSLLHFYFFLL